MMFTGLSTYISTIGSDVAISWYLDDTRPFAYALLIKDHEQVVIVDQANPTKIIGQCYAELLRNSQVTLRISHVALKMVDVTHTKRTIVLERTKSYKFKLIKLNCLFFFLFCFCQLFFQYFY